MARLFFALWPAKPARAALAAWAATQASACGGRPVPEGNLHLTLVFLGEVDASRIEALRQLAQDVAGSAFTLTLDRIGEFRRTGVVWAGCRRAPAGLLGLQAALERAIREAGFSPDDRPFAPHLTLVRRTRDPVNPQDIEPVSWCPKAFALVEAARGKGTYRTLAEWPLGEEKT
ncbi:MAG: RNA 2',3'-cyclic phosphodiesterase [Betaproteobacteria bacterium]|nr:RNA 2',3'-cyclic phosphodiesterase [Betaproteobacteria bacterium]